MDSSLAGITQGYKDHLAIGTAKTEHPVEIKILIGGKEFNTGSFFAENIERFAQLGSFHIYFDL
jgi:hypothetical protein